MCVHSTSVQPYFIIWAPRRPARDPAASALPTKHRRNWCICTLHRWSVHSRFGLRQPIISFGVYCFGREDFMLSFVLSFRIFPLVPPIVIFIFLKFILSSMQPWPRTRQAAARFGYCECLCRSSVLTISRNKYNWSLAEGRAVRDCDAECQPSESNRIKTFSYIISLLCHFKWHIN